MKRRNVVLAVVAVVVLGLVPATAMAGNNIVVTLKGPGNLITENPPLADPYLCYPGELVNTKTGRTIGDGVDCLLPLGATGAGTVTLHRVTFLNFRQGTVVAEGLTTVAEVIPGFDGFVGLDGAVLNNSPEITHIVGDISENATDSGGNILAEYGTGRFSNRDGAVRLSGAVNMSGFPGVIVFTCIFVIDLD